MLSLTRYGAVHGERVKGKTVRYRRSPATVTGYSGGMRPPVEIDGEGAAEGSDAGSQETCRNPIQRQAVSAG